MIQLRSLGTPVHVREKARSRAMCIRKQAARTQPPNSHHRSTSQHLGQQARTRAPRPTSPSVPAPRCTVTSTDSNSMIPRQAKSSQSPHLDQYSDKEGALQLQAPRDHHVPTAVSSTNSPLPNLQQQSPASRQVLPSTTTQGLRFKSARPCPGTAFRGHSSAAHRVPLAVHTPVSGTRRPPRSASQPYFSQGWPAGNTDAALTCQSAPPGRPGPAPPAAPVPQSPEGLRGAAARSSCRARPPNPSRPRHHAAAGISTPGAPRLLKRARGQRPRVKPARANQVPAPASIAAVPHQSCHWVSPGSPHRSSPAGTANRINK
ncbi:hypothetical protein NDU88_001278 [Pleurodeles waltl]|uniref:Uncharacterized protein n=1 Tax=Pleurodeles waltl TaxID=8319 RepID=A0AAV7RCC8_PLEWA|nr:hypothetical protein NDU88_001278 [Pleurodeles waltl]